MLLPDHMAAAESMPVPTTEAPVLPPRRPAQQQQQEKEQEKEEKEKEQEKEESGQQQGGEEKAPVNEAAAQSKLSKFIRLSKQHKV